MQCNLKWCQWWNVYLVQQEMYVKSKLINMAWARDKEKNLSPQQEMNPWPPEHRAGALSTELRELLESKVI